MDFVKVDEAAEQAGCSPEELLEAAIDGQLSFAIYSHSDLVQPAIRNNLGKVIPDRTQERRSIGEWIYPEREVLRALLDGGMFTTGAFCRTSSGPADLWLESKRKLSLADLWMDRAALKTYQAREKDTINPRRERTLLATIAALDAMMIELVAELETHAKTILSENNGRAPTTAGWSDLYSAASVAKKRFTNEKIAAALKARDIDVSATTVKNVMADARKIQPKT